MRRLIIEEPVSRAAVWSPRVALFSVAVCILAVGLLRFQLVELRAGSVALVAGLALAAGAIVLSLAAFVRIWREGRRGVATASFGLLIAIAVLAWPAFELARGLTLPALTDVTTDIESPPSFSLSRAALAARGGRTPPDPPPEARQRQREAYPFVAPLTLDIGAETAFALARRAAEARGWRVVDAVPPGGRVGTGRIDAVDRTFLLRLPDDVTVRIRPRADGSRIDVRSASRLGPHDLGANARRIRAFLDELSSLALAVE
jgi:uncharacterized protein (DUF1499 family)